MAEILLAEAQVEDDCSSVTHVEIYSENDELINNNFTSLSTGHHLITYIANDAIQNHRRRYQPIQFCYDHRFGPTQKIDSKY